MFLWLWQNLRGYVTIVVTGFSVERFINMAAHKGVYLWDVAYTSAGVRMNVSIKGFRQLKECGRKTNCKFKILERNGVPFVLHKYRKRKIFVGGILFFIAFIYFLSCFVWLIDIRGNHRIGTDQLLAFCAGEGLRNGAFKYKINNKQLKTDLMNNFHDISWLDIQIKGTRAIIRLTETIPAPPVIDKTTPCNIVAAKDGLITGIVTGAGKPLVKQGDVVRKGDVLVSGAFLTEGDNGAIYKQVHAYAEVWAKMYTEINLDVPLTYEDKEYTGQETRMYSIQAFGRNFDLFHMDIAYGDYTRTVSYKQLSFGQDYPLPVILAVYAYREFNPVTRTRTVDEAKALAEKMITARIIREFDFAADITDKSVAIQETPDKLYVKALITTNERIDSEAPVT